VDAGPVYWCAMRARSLVHVLLLLLFGSGVARTDALAPEVARARVEHHLQQVQQLTAHFETLMTESCRRFSSPAEWDAYVDRETDQLVLLMAHLEQAWVEAKRTPDDDVRRTAKRPRAGVERIRQLAAKLNGCAELNGASFTPETLWRRIERDVPRRQADIALPAP
jgi:hypothetical protein